MKKFINDAVNVVPEALRGLARAHREIVSLHEKPAFVARAPLAKGKVALVSGGGSGHEPLHAGFVGYGMLDAACPGQVFTSPTPDQISAAAVAVESEMELGVGIHGEPGRRRVATRPADAVAAELVGAILQDLAPRKGEPLLLFLNGFGGTPLLELYLMFDAAARRLAAEGLTIARSLVGNFVTSLEMAGCSVTLTRLDEELLRLWDAPVHTAALRWGR